MGFIEDIEWIISQLPKERQTFLFSATMPREVESLAKRHLRKDYKFVKVITEELKPKIEERLIKLNSSRQKLSELEKILREHLLEKVIVFVKTKKDAREITEELKRRGFNVVSLHGDMTQRQRENSLRLFKEGKVKIVVATDVASRGLDIKGVSLVINYHIPEDPEVYIHRIGRTGRIGSYGKAYSLVTPEDSRALMRIKKLKERVEGVVGKEVEVFINTADSKEENSVYITVTGTSAEQGDDGQVGRGNRVNGLITPYRPMSLEAAAGKNPVSHIGKIYNRVANLIAQRVVKEIEEVEESYCYIVSQIGKPINEPQVLDVSVRTKKDIKAIEEVVRRIAQEELDRMPEVWKGFVEGLYPVA